MAESKELKETTNVDKIEMQRKRESLKSDNDTLIDLYKNIKVTDSASYTSADEAACTLHTQKKAITTFWGPIKALSWQRHQLILASEKEDISLITERQGELNNGMKAWNQAQEKKRAEILRKQREEQEAERKKEEAELAKAKETSKVQPAPKAFTPKPVETVQMAPKSTTGFRTNYKWELIDLAALPDKYKTVNEKMLNKIVTAEEGKADIPGIRQWSEQSAVNRSK